MDASVSTRGDAPALDHATVRTIIIGVMLSMFLAALDQTIVATALPTIGGELGDLQNLSWVVTAYLLAATAVTPLYGKLADIRGRRTVMLTAIAIFIVGSVACALSTSMLGLILARGLQGLGGGGLISLAHTIIGDAVTPRERSRYMGYFGAVFALSSVLGPVLGGFLTQAWHWSAIFWINIPLGLIAFVMTFTALRKLPRHERPHKIDLIGAVLLVAAAVLLLLALSWGGQAFAWNSATILGLFGASAAAWVLFAVRLMTAPEPFLPLTILGNRIVATATLSGFFGVGAMVGLSIYLPIFFQSAYGMEPSMAGLALVPFSAGTVAGAQIAGRGMAKMERYKRIPFWGMIITIVVTGSLSLFAQDLPFTAVEIALVLLGLGIGTMFPVTVVVIQNAVVPHQMGMAIGTMNFMRALGSAILVAAFGAIFLAGLGNLHAEGQSVEAIAERARETGASLGGAFHGVFLAATVCFIVAFVFFVMIEERPLRGNAPAGPILTE